MSQAAVHWFDAPRPGDIVWCRFPQGGIFGPGPKSRPALVLQVGEADGHAVARVAYGTSQKVHTLFSGEFAILPEDTAAYAVSGLSHATKFDLGVTRELDYNNLWFAVPPGAPCGPTPRLGLLHPSLMRIVQSAHAATRAGRRG